jgi:hypothetical protein
MRRGAIAVLFGLGQGSQSLVGLFVERVQTLLPPTVTLNSNLNTPKDHLFAAAKINAQLDDVSIFELERLRLDIRLTEPDVV